MSDLESHPIVPVIVLEDAEDAEPLAEALLAGGLQVIEITFRTDAAAESINRIVRSFPEMLVGAGTVVTKQQAKEAIEVGSRFGLAPGTDPETISIFRNAGIPFIPGVATASDIQTAYREGCQYLKFFPAGAIGGPSFLKSMAAPYANLGIRFCPTGGVSLDNMTDYLSLPYVFAIGGSWIATKDDIAAKNWKTITENAKQARIKLNQL